MLSPGFPPPELSWGGECDLLGGHHLQRGLATWTGWSMPRCVGLKNSTETVLVLLLLGLVGPCLGVPFEKLNRDCVGLVTRVNCEEL